MQRQRCIVDSTDKILVTLFQLYTSTILCAFRNDDDFFCISTSFPSTVQSWAIERQKLSFVCNGVMEFELLLYCDVGICKATKGIQL